MFSFYHAPRCFSKIIIIKKWSSILSCVNTLCSSGFGMLYQLLSLSIPQGGGGGMGAGWVRAAVRIPKLRGSHTLNGVSHNEGVGGCSLGGVEHRGLNLWLHPHQCHGRAHSLTGECYNHTPVCHRPSVCCTCGSLHLHSAKEELTQD